MHISAERADAADVTGLGPDVTFEIRDALAERSAFPGLGQRRAECLEVSAARHRAQNFRDDPRRHAVVARQARPIRDNQRLVVNVMRAEIRMHRIRPGRPTARRVDSLRGEIGVTEHLVVTLGEQILAVAKNPPKDFRLLGGVLRDERVARRNRLIVQRGIRPQNLSIDVDTIRDELRAQGIGEECAGVGDGFALDLCLLDDVPGEGEDIGVLLAPSPPVIVSLMTLISLTGGTIEYFAGWPGSPGSTVMSMQLSLKFKPLTGAAYQSVR
jgi:hypothetical protein